MSDMFYHFMFLSLFFSPVYSKNSKIVKHYYNLKELFYLNMF